MIFVKLDDDIVPPFRLFFAVDAIPDMLLDIFWSYRWPDIFCLCKASQAIYLSASGQHQIHSALERWQQTH